MEAKISSQNLIKQVRVESPSVQPGFYKAVLFDTLSVISAILVGYSYQKYLIGQWGGNILLVALFSFACLSVFQALFSKSISRRFLILVLEAGGVLIFFFSYDIRILAGTAAAMIVFNFWGYLLGRSELENGLEIKFFKAAWPVLKKVMTALGILLVVLYAPQLDRGNAFISRDSFKYLFDSIGGVVHNFYPNVDPSSSIGKLAEDLTRFETQDNTSLKNLSSAQKEAVIKDSASKVVSDLGTRFGINISGDKTASEVLYDVIVSYLGNWKNSLGNWFLVGWAVAVFFILRGFGVFFYWAAGFFSFLIYQILLAGGFVHIIGESRTHEVLEF